MTKAEVINEITKETGINSAKASIILESFISSIKEYLEEGEEVYIRGFGSFVHKKRAEKLARNINKKTTMLIPEHYIPFFKPSLEFKELIKKSDKMKKKKQTEKDLIEM